MADESRYSIPPFAKRRMRPLTRAALLLFRDGAASGATVRFFSRCAGRAFAFDEIRARVRCLIARGPEVV